MTSTAPDEPSAQPPVDSSAEGEAESTTPVDRQTPTGMFASFEVPQFRIIWVGTFLYYLSIFTGIIARGALAKELGGTNTALGVVTLAFGATSLLAVPVGGVAADRVPKRRILLAGGFLLALSSGWLGVTELFDLTRFWMLVAVSAIQAIAFSMLVPARMAYTVELVGPGRIGNAIALSQISLNANRVLGPALAGAMLGVAWLGFAAIYLFSAALSAISLACFALLGPGEPDPNRPRRAPLADLADGVAYVRSLPSVRIVVVLAVAVTMIGFPYITFLPSVSEDFFDAGSEGFAWLSLVGAVGGLVAGLAVARAADGNGRRIQFGAGVGIAAGLGLLAWAPTFALALAASFVVGCFTAAFQTMNGTLALGGSDPAYHGRVQSLLQLGFSAFGLASLPLGALADLVGLRQMLAVMAALTLLIVVVIEAFWPPPRGGSTGSARA